MGKILTDSLYTIAPELRVLMEAEEFDSDQFTALTMAFKQKAEGLTYFMGELEAFAGMAEAEADRISKRAKSAKNRVNRLKEYLKGCMEEAEMLEMEFGTKNLKIQNNPPKIIIDDPDRVPAKFKTAETTVKIDKAAIKREIKNKHVDGVHIEQGTSLRIR